MTVFNSKPVIFFKMGVKKYGYDEFLSFPDFSGKL